MATATWRTCRERDGMRPPKFRPSWSIGRRVMVILFTRDRAQVAPLDGF